MSTSTETPAFSTRARKAQLAVDTGQSAAQVGVTTADNRKLRSIPECWQQCENEQNKHGRTIIDYMPKGLEGNCFYCQLAQILYGNPHLFGRVRKEVAEWMSDNKKEMLQFLTENTVDFTNLSSKEKNQKVEDWISRIRTNKTWTREEDIAATSRAFKNRILLYTHSIRDDSSAPAMLAPEINSLNQKLPEVHLVCVNSPTRGYGHWKIAIPSSKPSRNVKLSSTRQRPTESPATGKRSVHLSPSVQNHADKLSSTQLQVGASPSKPAPPLLAPPIRQANPNRATGAERSSFDFVVSSDGSCKKDRKRDSVGHCAFGAVIEHVQSGEKKELAGYMGKTTVPNAEYVGAIAGLKHVHSINPRAKVLVYIDSELVANQLNGTYRINNTELADKAEEFHKVHESSLVTVEWRSRIHNERADQLANEALTNYLATRLKSGKPAPPPEVAAVEEDITGSRTDTIQCPGCESNLPRRQLLQHLRDKHPHQHFSEFHMERSIFCQIGENYYAEDHVCSAKCTDFQEKVKEEAKHQAEKAASANQQDEDDDAESQEDNGVREYHPAAVRSLLGDSKVKKKVVMPDFIPFGTSSTVVAVLLPLLQAYTEARDRNDNDEATKAGCHFLEALPKLLGFSSLRRGASLRETVKLNAQKHFPDLFPVYSNTQPDSIEEENLAYSDGEQSGPCQKSIAISSFSFLRSPNDVDRPTEEMSQRGISKIVNLVKRGHLRKANQLLQNSKRAVRITEHVVQELRKLHPPAPETEEPFPTVPDKIAERIYSPQDIVKALRGMDKASAAGWSGLTVGHALFIATSPTLRNHFAIFLSDIINGKIEGLLKVALQSARLIAIESGKGIRPIAIGEVFLRLAGRMALARIKDPELLFDGIQFGVGAKNGADRMIHSAYAIAEALGPTCVIAKIDLSKAFQNRNRHDLMKELLSAGVKVEPILKMFHWLYSAPSDLLIFSESGDLRTTIKSEHGVKQGDPLSPLVFAISMHPILKKIKTITGCTVMAYIDDVIFIGNPDQCKQASELLESSLTAIGMQINKEAGKSTIYSPNATEAVDEHSQVASTLGLAYAVGFPKLLGIFLGQSEAAKSKITTDLQSRFNTFLSRIDYLPPEIAWRILRSCGLPMANYIMRNADPTATEDIANTLDTLVQTKIKQIFKLSWTNEDDKAYGEKQLALPVNKGGGGVPLFAQTRLSAATASRCSAMPTIHAQLRERSAPDEIDEPIDLENLAPNFWKSTDAVIKQLVQNLNELPDRGSWQVPCNAYDAWNRFQNLQNGPRQTSATT